MESIDSGLLRSNTEEAISKESGTVDNSILCKPPPSRTDQPFDSVDVGFTRKPGNINENEKAHLFDCFVAVISICTYIADIGTDILAARQYFQDEQWKWFAPTILLIILPSLVLQLFSSKWYHDDHDTQTLWSYMLHFLQCGAIER